MGVAATTQSVIIHMNTLSRAITYQGVVKFIDDKYWETEIVPELFPMWHSDRDKLEVFTAFKDDHYQVTRNKYVRNPKDKTYFDLCRHLLKNQILIISFKSLAFS